LTGVEGETIFMLIDGQELQVPAGVVRKVHLQHSFDNH